MIRILLLAILVLLVARAIWKLVGGILEVGGGTPRKRMKKPGVKLVRDPVCGTYVAPGSALSLTTSTGTHFFCSDECRSRFRSA